MDYEIDLERLDPHLTPYYNQIRCWPSVGGIMVADRVSAVELEFIHLDRFHVTHRSFNETEENTFCRISQRDTDKSLGFHRRGIRYLLAQALCRMAAWLGSLAIIGLKLPNRRV